MFKIYNPLKFLHQSHINSIIPKRPPHHTTKQFLSLKTKHFYVVCFCLHTLYGHLIPMTLYYCSLLYLLLRLLPPLLLSSSSSPSLILSSHLF